MARTIGNPVILSHLLLDRSARGTEGIAPTDLEEGTLTSCPQEQGLSLAYLVFIQNVNYTCRHISAGNWYSSF